MSSEQILLIGDHLINILSHGEGERHFTCLRHCGRIGTQPTCEGPP